MRGSAILVIGTAVAACSSAPKPLQVRVLAEPGRVVLPACRTSRPERPTDKSGERLYGAVLVGYTIQTDGRVTQASLEDAKASPVLFEAVKEWLDDCLVSGGVTKPKQIVELFTFPPWDNPPPVEPVLDAEGLSDVTRPVKHSGCSPDRPPPALRVRGTMIVRFKVHSNGQVGDVSLEHADVPAGLLPIVRSWLQSCPYDPARRDGKPVAVHLRETITFEVN